MTADIRVRSPAFTLLRDTALALFLAAVIVGGTWYLAALRPSLGSFADQLTWYWRFFIGPVLAGVAIGRFVRAPAEAKLRAGWMLLIACIALAAASAVIFWMLNPLSIAIDLASMLLALWLEKRWRAY